MTMKPTTGYCAYYQDIVQYSSIEQTKEDAQYWVAESMALEPDKWQIREVVILPVEEWRELVLAKEKMDQLIDFSENAQFRLSETEEFEREHADELEKAYAKEHK